MLIFVLDPHPLVCEIISMLIRREVPEVNIINVNSLKRLNLLIDKYDGVDYVFIEPQSSDFFGAAGVEHITERLPNTTIIAITDSEALLDPTYPNLQYAGVRHIINKRNSIKTISAELRKIINPKNPILQEQSQKFDVIKISKRQIQMLNFLEHGYTNSQIAEKLGIRENTVKVHFFRLFKLLGVSNRLQALSLAKMHGFISKSTH